MTINVISHTQSTHGQVLSPQYHFNNYHFFIIIEVSVPSQESERSCICVFGGSMLPLFLIFYQIQELFRACGICVFHFIDIKRHYSYQLYLSITTISHTNSTCILPQLVIPTLPVYYHHKSYQLYLSITTISHTNSTCLLPQLVIPTLPVYYHNQSYQLYLSITTISQTLSAISHTNSTCLLPQLVKEYFQFLNRFYDIT